MKRPRNGSTMKQVAYARRIWGAEGQTKKEIALSVGYSPSVAGSVSTHIEKTEGFHNAMKALAVKSNNLALAALAAYEARGFDDFSNKDLNGALNAIANAWTKFNGQGKDSDKPNPLKLILQQRVEKQTVNVSQSKKP